ncbi:hypothetical protein A2U01_0013621 [Trifolium medium]|uniref:Uncharacterized protein n=1 Tax=Trifolium medium TaxID=97028 RepID=A0A392MYS8_9FABA|nr:hypothetical protein [Trifolium medium]
MAASKLLVCLDPEIINAFLFGGSHHTPAKMIFKPSTNEFVEALIQAEQVADSGCYLSKRKLGDAFQDGFLQEGEGHQKRSSH